MDSAMADNRVPRGLLISALGAAGLAISMFLPWYSVSITANGAAEAQKQFASVAQQYGNANLQAMAGQVGAQFSAFAGHPIATLSAHQALKHLSLVILLLAGVSLLGSLLRLADVSEVSGDQIAIVGFAALLCVLFRLLSPPDTQTDLISLSLSWGGWLALVAAAAIVAGGIFTPSAGRSGVSRGRGDSVEHEPVRGGS
jgi:hypothetical protein